MACHLRGMKIDNVEIEIITLDIDLDGKCAVAIYHECKVYIIFQEGKSCNRLLHLFK